MKNILSKIAPGTLISQLMAGYTAYYLLLTDNPLHCSIAYIIHYAHTLALKQHLLLLGLLPIYIAVVVFGTGMLGFILGKWLNDFLPRTFKQKRTKASITS